MIQPAPYPHVRFLGDVLRCLPAAHNLPYEGDEPWGGLAIEFAKRLLVSATDFLPEFPFVRHRDPHLVTRSKHTKSSPEEKINFASGLRS